MKAHLARYERLIGSNTPENDTIEIRGIRIDKTARRVWVNGEEKQFNLDDDVKAIYTVTLEYKTKNAYKAAIGDGTSALGLDDLDSVTVSEGADIDNKSWVAYKVDSSDLDVLFVVDFVY